MNLVRRLQCKGKKIMPKNMVIFLSSCILWITQTEQFFGTFFFIVATTQKFSMQAHVCFLRFWWLFRFVWFTHDSNFQPRYTWYINSLNKANIANKKISPESSKSRNFYFYQYASAETSSVAFFNLSFIQSANFSRADFWVVLVHFKLILVFSSKLQMKNFPKFHNVSFTNVDLRHVAFNWTENIQDKFSK